jgi:hypothetical protein
MLNELTLRQRELEELARDFQALRTFAAELRRASKGKTFDVRSELAWASLHALHRMLVIDLAAWVRSLYPAWLRRNIQGKTLADLRASRTRAGKIMEDSPIFAPTGVRAAISRHRNDALLQGQREALRRLFGKVAVARGKAEAADVKRLENRLERWAVNLDAWRNVHAHRYGAQDPTLKALRLQDIARRISWCCRLLNDFQLLLDGSTRIFPRVEASTQDPRCRDLVDLILVGTMQYSVEEAWSKEPGQFLWQRREAHYRRMHARPRASKGESFNR